MKYINILKLFISKSENIMTFTFMALTFLGDVVGFMHLHDHQKSSALGVEFPSGLADRP